MIRARTPMEWEKTYFTHAFELNRDPSQVRSLAMMDLLLDDPRVPKCVRNAIHRLIMSPKIKPHWMARQGITEADLA